MDGAELVNRFLSHQATPEMVENMEAARSQIIQTAGLFDTLTTDCREKSLAVHALEDALTWINKAITRNGTPQVLTIDPIKKAQRAYEAYGEVTGGKNFLGDPMPTWEELSDTIQAAWIAASNS